MNIKTNKPINRKRNIQIKFYLTQEEKNKLDELVEKSKMNQSKYIRKAILKDKVIIIEDLKPVLVELKREGNNLYQIAKMSYDRVSYINELKQIKKDFRLVWNKVIEALKEVR